MGISPFQAQQIIERLERNRRVVSTASVESDQSIREVGKGGLQQQIIDWCDSQWPKWVYDFPRTDKRSTVPIGRHDATIWGPYPKCFVIEAKAKGKKRTVEQNNWAARLRLLGWEVKEVYSLEEFKQAVGL